MANRLVGERRKLCNTLSLVEHINLYLSVNRETQCREWQGTVDKDGYGKITHSRQTIRPHRAIYESFYRVKLQPQQQLNHTCDSRRCCNALHLYVGTQQQNIKDRDRKNRQARGEKNANTSLTESKVREIRNLRAQGNTLEKIAKTLSIPKGTVAGITSRRNWGWLE